MKATLNLAGLLLLIFLTVNCTRNKLAQQNASIARSFIEAWDSHDASRLTSLFADEFVYLEVASGRKYIKEETLASYFNLTIEGMPDSEFELVSVVANENFAAVEWIWEGTNSVGWDFMGIPATGKHMKLPGVSVMEIENQKIVRNNDYWDWSSFMKGIGVTP